jgi:hypothetical protein
VRTAIFPLLTVCFLASPEAVRPQEAPKTEPGQLKKQLDALAAELGQEPEKGVAAIKPPNPDRKRLLKALAQLPPGDPLRVQAIALARKYASPSDLRKASRESPAFYRKDHERLYFAWRVLLDLGVLRKGMSLEEAVAVLGAPAPQTTTRADWYYSSPMHVNPQLACTLKEGRVQSFEIARR